MGWGLDVDKKEEEVGLEGGNGDGASLPDRQLMHERGPPSVVGGGVD